MTNLQCFLFLSAAVIAAPPIALADVVVAPQRLVFDNAFDGKTLNVTVDGEPASAGAFEKIQVMSDDGFEYKNIFRIEERDGGLQITPTQSAFNGAYFLDLKRGDQTSRVPLFVSIAPEETVAEDEPAQPESSLPSAEQTTAPAETYQNANVIDLPIPEVMYRGEMLELPMTTEAEREWTWVVNGDVVQDGFGSHTFQYQFPSPGTYTLSYLEREDDTVIGYGTRNILVLGEAPRSITVPAGEPVTLMGPEGFAEYEWTVNGTVQSQQIGLQWTFTQPGVHEIRMTARTLRPDQGDVYEQRTYQVAVQ